MLCVASNPCLLLVVSVGTEPPESPREATPGGSQVEPHGAEESADTAGRQEEIASSKYASLRSMRNFSGRTTSMKNSPHENSQISEELWLILIGNLVDLASMISFREILVALNQEGIIRLNNRYEKFAEIVVARGFRATTKSNTAR